MQVAAVKMNFFVHFSVREASEIIAFNYFV